MNVFFLFILGALYSRNQGMFSDALQGDMLKA